MNNKSNYGDKSRIDWMITLAPFILIVCLAIFLFKYPEQSNEVIDYGRNIK